MALKFRRGNPLPPKPCRQFQKSLDACRWKIALKSGWLENLLLKKEIREENFFSERMSKKKYQGKTNLLSVFLIGIVICGIVFLVFL